MDGFGRLCIERLAISRARRADWQTTDGIRKEVGAFVRFCCLNIARDVSDNYGVFTMQFALPPRSSPHSVRNRSSTYGLRRRHLRICGIFSFLAIAILLLLSYGFSSTDTPAPKDGPKVVIVTVLDEDRFSDQYIQRIKANREDYVARHGTLRDIFGSISAFERELAWSVIDLQRNYS